MAATAVSYDNPNLAASSRELWKRTVKDQVFRKIPIFAKLLEGKQIKVKAGKIKQSVKTANLDDQMQDYAPTEGLNTSKKTFLDSPWWGVKYFQLPVVKTVEEVIENSGDDQPVDLVQALVDASHEGFRLALAKRAYGIGPDGAAYDSTDDRSTTAASKRIQSIRQALSHTLTYGHCARSTSAQKAWWAGASVDGTFSDSGTNYTPSMATFRRCIDAISLYKGGNLTPASMLCIVGPSIFRELQAQAESKSSGVQMGASKLAKYGLTAVEIDGIDVVLDYLLTEAVCTNASKWFFLLDTADFEFRVHPLRPLTFTGFTWQGDRDEGADEWLGRIMGIANLVCYQPNGSIFLSNVY